MDFMKNMIDNKIITMSSTFAAGALTASCLYNYILYSRIKQLEDNYKLMDKNIYNLYSYCSEIRADIYKKRVDDNDMLKNTISKGFRAVSSMLDILSMAKDPTLSIFANRMVELKSSIDHNINMIDYNIRASHAVYNTPLYLDQCNLFELPSELDKNDKDDIESKLDPRIMENTESDLKIQKELANTETTNQNIVDNIIKENSEIFTPIIIVAEDDKQKDQNTYCNQESDDCKIEI